mgnify:CR=1 FL=1
MLACSNEYLVRLAWCPPAPPLTPQIRMWLPQLRVNWSKVNRMTIVDILWSNTKRKWVKPLILYETRMTHYLIHFLHLFPNVYHLPILLRLHYLFYLVTKEIHVYQFFIHETRVGSWIQSIIWKTLTSPTCVELICATRILQSKFED